MDTLLKEDQVATLEKLAAEGSTEHVRRRAKILLMYHAGRTTREIAEAVGLSPGRVAYWRREFLKRGMAIFPAPATAAPAEATPIETPTEDAMSTKTAKPRTAKKSAAKGRTPKKATTKSQSAKAGSAKPKAAKPKAAKKASTKGKAAKKSAAKPKASKKSSKSRAAQPAPITGGLLKKAEKIVLGVADVVGAKALKQLEEISSQESFREFVAYVEKQRKKLLKKLDAKGLKKKQIRFLRAQLKELEAQIAKAEKLLRKLEG